jgi:hypothetical protein
MSLLLSSRTAFNNGVRVLGVFQPLTFASLQPARGLITTKPFRVRHLRWLSIKETPACYVSANGL